VSLSERAQELLPERVWLAEDRVVPHGVDTSDGYNYDLALHTATGSSRGVLVVKAVLQFNFIGRDDLDWDGYARDVLMTHRISYGPDDYLKAMTHRVATFAYDEETGNDWEDGDTSRTTEAYRTWYRSDEGRTAARAHAQNWSRQEKRNFMYQWRRLIQRHWELKFKIRKEAGSAALSEIDVVYDVRTTWDETWSDHYQINAINVGETPDRDGLGPRSAVSRRLGQAYIDNRDIHRRSDNQQIGCVHEYGHMQGLPDEYPADSAWAGDDPSVMNGGMDIRPRHYTPLADWVSRKVTEWFERRTSVATPSEYYVEGSDGRKWTIANAGIYEGTNLERGNRWFWE